MSISEVSARRINEPKLHEPKLETKLETKLSESEGIHKDGGQ